MNSIILLLAALVAVEPAMELREGRTSLSASRGRFAFEAGQPCIRLNGGSAACACGYSAWGCGRPFRDAAEYVLRTDAARAGGRVRLILRNVHVPGKPVERTALVADWTEVTRFQHTPVAGRLLQVEALEFEYPKLEKEFRFAVLGLEARRETTAADAFEVAVETGNPICTLRPEGEAQFVLRNTAERKLKAQGEIKVKSFFGQTAAVPFDVSVRPGETASVKVPRLAEKGIWRGKARIASEGTTAERDVRLAVLPPRGVTPRQPFGVFRAGFNWHSTVMGDKDIADSLVALARCGAKIVRCDVYEFQCVEAAGAGVWNAPYVARRDWLLGEIEKAGLALDANIIRGCPAWASTGKGKMRPKAGAFRDYCRRLAAKLGTRVDYYEIGNEWDIRRAEQLTTEDAIAMQKEAWEGIKAGCPAARVATPGLAFAGYDHRLAERGHDHFQERFLFGAKGAFDIHCVHQHGPFSEYPPKIREMMKIRRETATTVPWFSNETALSSSWGNEDRAAETVYKKILYAWANGSTDYIWYNLRGTGWLDDDGEAGYGVVTADFRPRAAFAAFASFNAIYSGLAFDGKLHEGSPRYAYRFRGTMGRDGQRRDVRVLAGWDDALTREMAISAKTDASAARLVDIMGNARDVPVVNGTVTWALGRLPTSLVLADCTRAEPDMAQLAKITIPEAQKKAIPPGAPETRAPDFRLDKVGQVTSLYVADLLHPERAWAGTNDLSAAVWVCAESAALRVTVRVRDNKAVGGRGSAEDLWRHDSIQFAFATPKMDGHWEIGAGMDAAGKPRSFVWIAPVGKDAEAAQRQICAEVRRAGDETVYSVSLPYGAELGLTREDLRAGMRFNLIVNDDDGAGRNGWIGIAPDLKDLSTAPYLLF